LLFFDYDKKTKLAIIRWSGALDLPDWARIILNICLNSNDYAERNAQNTITMPWWTFLSTRRHIFEVIASYKLEQNVHYNLSDLASNLLLEAKSKDDAYYHQSPKLSESDVASRLADAGFVRKLTDQQLRNVTLLSHLPSGATFSVPGAGKTTEALAFFALKASSTDKLLIVAPKNAFAAWEEQYSECFGSSSLKFERLRKTSEIKQQLKRQPQFSIIGYQQLTRVVAELADFMEENDVHVFLDESHRIKNAASLSAQSILRFSHLPKSKLIMSGTPMPQSLDDLVPQFNFLYPEVKVDSSNVVSSIQNIYVRTSKGELGLPPVLRKLTRLPMDPAQKRLYDLLKSELAREAEQALSDQSRHTLRRFGKSVSIVLQFISNPALLASKPEFQYSDELSETIAEGEGPKLRYVVEKARSLVKQGQKVLIWTNFVKNVEYLAWCLEDVGSVYIHGGVDAGSDEDDDTREGRIRKFHSDPGVNVMIANPAAASEGISLHKVCHYAIYLDRNFNAAQYLQSEDRIHRLGLANDQNTTLEIVECEGTIDETVRFRLQSKVDAMAIALSDNSLNVEPISNDEEVNELDSSGLDFSDLEMLCGSLLDRANAP